MNDWNGDHTSRKRLAVLLLLITSLATPLFAKRNDDVVTMKNGDRFTGEIKGLEHGELAFKSSYMTESVHLNWDEVSRIQSQDPFIVSLTNGKRINGYVETVANGTGANNIRVEKEGTATVVPQDAVVKIEQKEASFWSQMNGSIDFGFSFASGNSSTDNSFATSLSYRTSKNTFFLDAASDLSRNDAESTTRHQVNFQHQRTLNQKWFTLLAMGFLHSDQQELDLRSTFGGGFGRRLFQTDQTNFSALAGGVFTREKYSASVGGTPERSNGEMLFGVQYTTFRFKTIDVTAATSVYPSLSDPGRFRLSSNGNLRFELVKDLYFSFRVYENFDNRPPVNAPKNDVGITTSLGWKF